MLAGGANLRKHIEIVREFGVSPVVALNVFPTDYPDEIDAVRKVAEAAGAHFASSTHVVDGGGGAVDLARAVVTACDQKTAFRYTYDLEDSLVEKLTKIATKVYGADGIDIAPAAAKELAHFEDLGYGTFPVVIAKTHLSLSHDPSLKGAPTGWRLPVREVRAAVGAGYIYAICGDMRTMPGLGRHPAAERIDIDDNGETIGLF